MVDTGVKMHCDEIIISNAILRRVNLKMGLFPVDRLLYHSVIEKKKSLTPGFRTRDNGLTQKDPD